ncbi:hypothetical protein C8R47DRAFT_1102234 [Mycena vitilis]|nr:hypothetical protein C8R47DRAFT_1102234 [Mycena vitilis]
MATYDAAALRSRRAAIQAQIAALEYEMSILRKEDEGVLQELAGVVYPFLTLPNEITSAIFTHYVDNGRRRQSPLCLASVCRLWRALRLALSNRSLWTNFESGWYRSDLLNLLRIWLPRAGGLPLRLAITLPQSSAADILHTLGQYSTQWQSLKIRSEGRITFPKELRGPFPFLTRLHLETLLMAPDGWTTLPLFSNSPLLREVHLGSIFLRNWQSAILWSHLTKLELEYFDIERSVDILGQTLNLEDLEFTCNNSGPYSAPSHPLILPHLHTLRLRLEDGPELLNYLVLPALQCIDLGFTHRSTDGIEGMVARSGCKPRRLGFCMYETGFERIYRCMTAMPSLRVWKMKCPDGSAADYHHFFDTLAQDLSILPALEALEITHCQAQIELPTLVRMLEARVMGEGKLKSFSLLFDDYRGHDEGMNDALEGLRGLRSQGLKVNIKSNRKWLSENISSQFLAEMGADDTS